MDCLYMIRGRFAEQYADAHRIPPGRRTAVHGPPREEDLPEAEALVVIVAGHDPELREAVDRIGFARGVPSVGVELLPRRIVCGPVVVPGETACYACHLRRIEQHTEQRAEGAGADEAAAAAYGLEEGFAPAHLFLARGLLAQAFAEMRGAPQDDGPGGTVRSFDLVTGGLSSARTVAVHGCTRCGARFREERSPVPALP
ncbi:TOMM precursor leader peptide-binding protein [Nocardiopsis suaedae]|uniref:TOMM leader peptide-binding protein n=1 Tax=Nocardiopsis suaedae TaxID=3018444 RepID=A0ABT4TIZ5_9ACTN|nr:TOMM precursor leader peptide-binding protein [Nocardiopsis suaedae]MDA2804668.1 TOMM precursor leader peptide-binding protein [Nocardiopsis suaedae]